MTLWASTDLLAKCKALARRPAVDQAVPDAQWYLWLSDAQAEVYPALFSRHPDLAYSAPVLMTTADGGYTYTFGSDAEAEAIRPMGHTELYPNLASIPDSPLVMGSDFLMEGSKIRMPNNTTRQFSGGPYARFVARPDVAITASVQPLLFPKNLRMLLVLKALEYWASRPGSGMTPDYYIERHDRMLNLAYVDLATSYNRAGGQSQRWWSLQDLNDGTSL